MEADKRPRMPVEEMSESSCRNPLVVDNVHLSILKELDSMVEVRRFKERDSKISSLLQLWVALITNPSKTDYIAEAFFTLFRKTTVAVLSPDWMSVTLALKEKLISAIGITGQALSPVIADCLRLCNVLRQTAHEPWKNKTWKHILDGNFDINDRNVQLCLTAEPEDVLLSRVQFLAQSGCERQAMSLARCCFKFFSGLKKNSWSTRRYDTIRSKERQGTKVANYCEFSSVEWFLFLLQKKNLAEIVKETTTLSCHEGVHLIKFLSRKPSTDALLQTLTNIFLVRDFMFPSNYCCTRELILLWVSLHEKRKISDIADAVRKLLVSYASTSAHFYLFVDVLWERFGSKLLSLYVEMYVRGLTADVNFLEVARSNEMRETVHEMETHISNVWHKLSTIFDDGSEEVARECMLSSFSMRPTEERLYILQSLTHSILGESQLQACSKKDQEEEGSRFVESEKCGNRNCLCGSSTCSSDAKNCSGDAESNQNSASLHPLLRRGMKGISYSCVKDLVSLLECVRCKTFQFNCFDWYRRSSELGEYLKAHAGNANTLFYANSENMDYLRAQIGNPNSLFHQSADDMDTESPSDEDMDYESSVGDRPVVNFPVVSPEGIPIHQSPSTVPFKQEQSSMWAKSELVPPSKMNPLFGEDMNFVPKAPAKPPAHVCQSSKSSSFSPLVNSSIGANSNVTKEVHVKNNHFNALSVGKMHLQHADHRHATRPLPDPGGSKLTIAGATEAMLRSVIMNNSPASDGVINKSTSFLTHKNNSNSANHPFASATTSDITVHGSHMSTVHPESQKYSFPHDVLNSYVKSPEAANPSLIQTNHHFLSSSNASVHQSNALPSCVPPSGGYKASTNDTFLSRSDISTSIQNVSKTVSSINASSSVYPQNNARPNTLRDDSESGLVGSKIHGPHHSNYIQQGNLSSAYESPLLSKQNKNANTLPSSNEHQGNMLLALLEERKGGLTPGIQNDPRASALNLTTHNLVDGVSNVETVYTRNSTCVPLSNLPDRKAKDEHSENISFKAKPSNVSEQDSVIKHTTHMNVPADASEGQVCSKIPIPVSINTIPITRMTVEQLSSNEEKTSIPAFKISMPPDMKKPFRNWFFPANLVIPKNSNVSGNDSLCESNVNSDCQLQDNAKPSENNAISIPGFIVFKSSKGKYFSSPPKIVKHATGESGNACETPARKIWTSYRSSFGEVACKKTASCCDKNIGASVQKVHLKQPEKCSDASVQRSLQNIKNDGQRCFQGASGMLNKSTYSVRDCNASNTEHKLPQFFAGSRKSETSPFTTAEPTVVIASKAVTSYHQTSVVASNVPHVISVQGKDIHPGFSPMCSERKIPPQNVSVSSSDKNLPLTDTQNSNKLERLGSPSVSTEKMCCSENEVVPCQSCSLSAAQAHQNDQSLKAGLSQRRDAAGVKPSGTSNTDLEDAFFQVFKRGTFSLCHRVLQECDLWPHDMEESKDPTESDFRRKIVCRSSMKASAKNSNKKTKLNQEWETTVNLMSATENREDNEIPAVRCEFNFVWSASKDEKAMTEDFSLYKKALGQTAPQGDTINELNHPVQFLLDERSVTGHCPPEEEEAMFHSSECFKNNWDCENGQVKFECLFKQRQAVEQSEASVYCFPKRLPSEDNHAIRVQVRKENAEYIKEKITHSERQCPSETVESCNSRTGSENVETSSHSAAEIKVVVGTPESASKTEKPLVPVSLASDNVEGMAKTTGSCKIDSLESKRPFESRAVEPTETSNCGDPVMQYSGKTGVSSSLNETSGNPANDQIKKTEFHASESESSETDCIQIIKRTETFDKASVVTDIVNELQSVNESRLGVVHTTEVLKPVHGSSSDEGNQSAKKKYQTQVEKEILPHNIGSCRNERKEKSIKTKRKKTKRCNQTVSEVESMERNGQKNMQKNITSVERSSEITSKKCRESKQCKKTSRKILAEVDEDTTNDSQAMKLTETSKSAAGTSNCEGSLMQCFDENRTSDSVNKVAVNPGNHQLESTAKFKSKRRVSKSSETDSEDIKQTENCGKTSTGRQNNKPLVEKCDKEYRQVHSLKKDSEVTNIVCEHQSIKQSKLAVRHTAEIIKLADESTSEGKNQSSKKEYQTPVGKETLFHNIGLYRNKRKEKIIRTERKNIKQRNQTVEVESDCQKSLQKKGALVELSSEIGSKKFLGNKQRKETSRQILAEVDEDKSNDPPKLSLFDSDDAECLGKNLVCPEIDRIENRSECGTHYEETVGQNLLEGEIDHKSENFVLCKQDEAQVKGLEQSPQNSASEENVQEAESMEDRQNSHNEMDVVVQHVPTNGRTDLLSGTASQEVNRPNSSLEFENGNTISEQIPRRKRRMGCRGLKILRKHVKLGSSSVKSKIMKRGTNSVKLIKTPKQAPEETTAEVSHSHYLRNCSVKSFVPPHVKTENVECHDVKPVCHDILLSRTDQELKLSKSELTYNCTETVEAKAVVGHVMESAPNKMIPSGFSNFVNRDGKYQGETAMIPKTKCLRKDVHFNRHGAECKNFEQSIKFWPRVEISVECSQNTSDVTRPEQDGVRGILELKNDCAYPESVKMELSVGPTESLHESESSVQLLKGDSNQSMSKNAMQKYSYCFRSTRALRNQNTKFRHIKIKSSPVEQKKASYSLEKLPNANKCYLTPSKSEGDENKCPKVDGNGNGNHFEILCRLKEPRIMLERLDSEAFTSKPINARGTPESSNVELCSHKKIQPFPEVPNSKPPSAGEKIIFDETPKKPKYQLKKYNCQQSCKFAAKPNQVRPNAFRKRKKAVTVPERQFAYQENCLCDFNSETKENVRKKGDKHKAKRKSSLLNDLLHNARARVIRKVKRLRKKQTENLGSGYAHFLKPMVKLDRLNIDCDEGQVLTPQCSSEKVGMHSLSKLCTNINVNKRYFVNSTLPDQSGVKVLLKKERCKSVCPLAFPTTHSKCVVQLTRLKTKVDQRTSAATRTNNVKAKISRQASSRNNSLELKFSNLLQPRVVVERVHSKCTLKQPRVFLERLIMDTT